MARPRRFAISMLPLGLCVAACTKQAPDPAPPRAADSAAPVAVAFEGTAVSPEAGAPLAAEGRSVTSAPDAGAAPAEPPVRVRVVTIGMHVGGGPYDEVTKEPIKRSVEPHFADLARCWKHVPQPRQADVGVDLVIEASGGRAKVSNPRTTAAGAGEGFVPCVVAFYEGIDFQRPKNGKTVVSYSVRFLP